MVQRNRWIVLLFIVLLAAPVVVTTFRYQQARYTVRKAVKQQMIAGMDRRHLTVLVFSKTDAERRLHWEHDREFEYLGQMYDVVEATFTGDSVHYLCWPDHHETRLNLQLNRLVNMAMGSLPMNQTNQKQLLDFLSKLFPPPASATLASALNHRGSWLVRSSHIPFSRTIETDLPPPRRG